MLKIYQPSSPVLNVVAGQNATLDLNAGPRYHKIDLIATVTKTAATSGFASATVADALALLNVKVNTISKRQHLATELDYINTRWAAGLGVKVYDNIANDLVTAVADTTSGSNTIRTTTFVLPVLLAEPFRDTYAARDSFAWPTQWKSGKTVNLQIEIGIPNNSGISAPVVRAMELIDFAFGSNVNGADIMPITHWFRQPETYSGTALAIRKWPFSGIVQQITAFCASGDDVATFEVKGDNVTKFKGSKAALDLLNNHYGWNTGGTNADRLDLGFDFSDNAADSIDMTQFGVFELDLTLTQAVNSNKVITLLSQVYRDALA